MTSNKNHNLPAFLVLLMVGITCYSTSFKNDFIWDDNALVVANEYIRQPKYIKEIFSTDLHHFGLDKSNFYRPLQALSYLIDYQFWKLNPVGYHLTNTIIHISNAFLIFLILSLILQFLTSIGKTKSKWIAFFTALIWLVHPLHTQVVAYIAGRADGLSVFFMLLSMYTFIVLSKEYCSAMFFVLALLSKEQAIITPLLIFMLDAFGVTNNLRKRFVKLIPFVLISIVYLILRSTVFNFPTQFTTQEIPELYARLLTSAQAIMILIGLIFMPIDLAMERNIEWATTFFSLLVAASVLAVLFFGILSISFRKKSPVTSLCLAWFFIAYIPALNILPMNANISEHWMYMPSIGLIFLVVYLAFVKLPVTQHKFIFCFLMVIVICLAGRLIIRDADFKNEIVFFNKILKRNNDNARIHYNLAGAYFNKEELEKSEYHLLETIKINPNFAAAYGNLGQLQYRKGNIDQAIILYQRANLLRPDLTENHANLAAAYLEKGMLPQAMAQANKTLELAPRHDGALNTLGIVYGNLHDYKSSEEYFKKALSINPDNESAQYNLDYLYSLYKQ